MVEGAPSRLRDARLAGGLTQQELANELTRRLGRTRPIHFTTISRIESGDLPVKDVAMIEAWAGACGVGDFRSLLGGDTGPMDDPLTTLVRSIAREEIVRYLKETASRSERRLALASHDDTAIQAAGGRCQ